MFPCFFEIQSFSRTEVVRTAVCSTHHHPFNDPPTRQVYQPQAPELSIRPLVIFNKVQVRAESNMQWDRATHPPTFSPPTTKENAKKNAERPLHCDTTILHRKRRRTSETSNMLQTHTMYTTQQGPDFVSRPSPAGPGPCALANQRHCCEKNRFAQEGPSSACSLGICCHKRTNDENRVTFMCRKTAC